MTTSVSYHRVQWIVKAGGLGKAEIEQWTGERTLEVYSIEVSDAGNSDWTLALEAKPSSENFEFYIERGDARDVKIDMLVRSSEALLIEPTEVRLNIWRWRIKKDIVAALLSQSPITFEIVVIIQTKPPVTVPKLASTCAELMANEITLDNVLEKLEIAVVFSAKEMEAKCLSLIFLYYKHMKETEAWKNLRPLLKAKVMDLMYDTTLETCAIVLDTPNPIERIMETIRQHRNNANQ